jgi:hypothetical protein
MKPPICASVAPLGLARNGYRAVASALVPNEFAMLANSADGFWPWPASNWLT